MGAEALSNHHIMIGKPPRQALSSELAEACQLETFFPSTDDRRASWCGQDSVPASSHFMRCLKACTQNAVVMHARAAALGADLRQSRCVYTSVGVHARTT